MKKICVKPIIALLFAITISGFLVLSGCSTALIDGMNLSIREADNFIKNF